MPNETTPNELGEVAVGAGDNPYPDRVEDVEKARVMAEAGDEPRTSAADHRRLAPSEQEMKEGNYIANYRDQQLSHANLFDRHAEIREDKAGAKYDREKNLVHDANMAEKMAHAEDPVQSIASRLEKSEDPADLELAKTLREEGNELAENARREYEKEQKLFEQEKRRVIGWVLGTIKGEIFRGSGRTPLVTTTPELDRDSYFDSRMGFGLGTASKEKLCKTVYELLGVEEPSKKAVNRAFDKRGVYGSEAVITLETESPETGLRIIDQRVVVPHGLLRKITENGRMVSIQRINN